MAASVGDALLSITVDRNQVARSIIGAVGGNENTVANEGKKLSKSLTGGLEGGLSGFQKFGGVVAGVGALVAGVATKMALDFESSLTSIKALTGSSAKDIDSYRSAILSLSGDVAQSPKQLAEALYFVSSAGFAGKEAIDVLTISAKAAAAGLTETQVVADAVTSAMNAYGHANLSAKEASDVLVQTVTDGKAEFADVAGSIGQVVNAASAAGISFKEVGASMATLTSAGISADEAATVLKSTIVALEAPSDKVKTLLAQMGISADSVRQSIRDRGLIATIQELGRRLHGNTGELLELIPNHRTLALVLGATGAQAEQYNVNLNHMRQATEGAGATARAFGERQKDVKFQLQQTVAAVQAAVVGFGEKLIPVVQGALDVLKATAGFFHDNEVAAYALAVVIGGPLVGAMIAWTVAEARLLASKLLSFWSGLGEGALALAGRLSVSSGALAAIGTTEAGAAAATAGLTAVMGPLQLALAGVVAGAAIYYYWLHRVKEINQEVVDSQALATNTAALAAVQAKTGVQISKDQAIAAYENAVALNRQTDVMKGAKTYADAFSDAQRRAAGTLTDLSEKTGVSTAKIVELANEMGVNLGKLTDETRQKLGAALGEWKQSVDSVGAATQVLGGKTDQLGGYVSSTAEKMKAAKDAASQLKDGLDLLIGVHVSASQATVNYHDQIDKLTQELFKNKATLDLHSEAGRANTSAVNEAINKILGEAQAFREEGQTVDQVNTVMGGHIAQLKQVLANAGFTTAQIDALVKQYNLVPPKVETTVTADTAQASAALAALIHQVDVLHAAAPGAVNFSARPGEPGFYAARAAGGPVYAGVPYTVGEHGIETFVPATDGYIISHADTVSGRSGGAAGPGERVTIEVPVSIDGERVAHATASHDIDAQRKLRRTRQ